MPRLINADKIPLLYAAVLGILVSGEISSLELIVMSSEEEALIS
jgi:hypothetical protein